MVEWLWVLFLKTLLLQQVQVPLCSKAFEFSSAVFPHRAYVSIQPKRCLPSRRKRFASVCGLSSPGLIILYGIRCLAKWWCDNVFLFWRPIHLTLDFFNQRLLVHRVVPTSQGRGRLTVLWPPLSRSNLGSNTA